MGMMFKLALRNVFRNKRRSLITFSAVMIGIASFIIMEGITESLQNQSIRMLKNVETAHLKVYAKGYWDERNKEPLKYRIKDFKKIEDIIKKKTGVLGVTGRINFQVRLYKGRNEMPCTGTAIDINGNNKNVFDLQDSVVKGKFLKNGEYVLLGTNIADLFNAMPGSWVTIEFKDKNGVYDAIQAQVSGIVDTGDPNIDENAVFVPMELAQERLDMKNEVTEIAVLLKSERRIERFKNDLEKELNRLSNDQSFELLTWEEQAADFLAFMRADAQGNYIIVYILLVIIIAGIMNTMMMAVYERVREIGTLMALGMKRLQIKNMFIIEGAIIGGIGALAGIFLGLLFMIQFSTNGLNIASMYGEDTNTMYLIKNYIYGSIRFTPFLLSFLIGVGAAIIASYIPARSAAKLKPVQALRHY